MLEPLSIVVVVPCPLCFVASLGLIHRRSSGGLIHIAPKPNRVKWCASVPLVGTSGLRRPADPSLIDSFVSSVVREHGRPYYSDEPDAFQCALWEREVRMLLDDTRAALRPARVTDLLGRFDPGSALCETEHKNAPELADQVRAGGRRP